MGNNNRITDEGVIGLTDCLKNQTSLTSVKLKFDAKKCYEKNY